MVHVSNVEPIVNDVNKNKSVSSANMVMEWTMTMTAKNAVNTATIVLRTETSAQSVREDMVWIWMITRAKNAKNIVFSVSTIMNNALCALMMVFTD